MSAQHHPPDKKATPRSGGVATAAITGQYKANDTPTLALWQSGLDRSQITAVGDHRRAHPSEPLPELLQRSIGSAWAHAGALQ